MRKASYLVCCAVFLGLGLNVAAAAIVTVNLTGHVTSVYDSSLPIVVGQAVTATYSYDSSTPLGTDVAYHPVAPPASISVSVGGQTYQSQSNWAYQIILNTGSSQLNSFDYVAAATAPTNPLSPPLPPNIGIHFVGWPASTAVLPTGAPPSGLLESLINVDPPNSIGFVAQVDSATLAPASLTISPASGIFLAQQNFDAALLLSSQTPIIGMQASIGGSPIALNYPGVCQLTTVSNGAVTALVCPNASAVLATLGSGPVTINWQVVFFDGSTIQQSVTWGLVR
jgi:hypothetical protein